MKLIETSAFVLIILFGGSCKKEKECRKTIVRMLPDSVKTWIPQKGDTFFMICSDGIKNQFYLYTKQFDHERGSGGGQCPFDNQEYYALYRSTYAGELHFRITSDTSYLPGNGTPFYIDLGNTYVAIPLNGHSGVFYSGDSQNPETIYHYTYLNRYKVDTATYDSVYHIEISSPRKQVFETDPVDEYICRNIGLIQYTQKNGTIWKRIK